jgi:hypothetical protein
MEQTPTDVFETTNINERIAMKEEYLPTRGSAGLWFQQRGMGLSSSNTRPSHNSKELIMINLVEEFTAVRIGFRIFTMKTVHSQMLEHRNQKGDLARLKNKGFGREINSAAKPDGTKNSQCQNNRKH